MKFRYFYTALCAVILCGAYFFTQFCAPAVSKEREYTLYASIYPVYTICKSLTEGVPGISVHQLLQPTDSDITEYELSDWDTAILENCDVAVFCGGGLESFSAYSNDNTIVIRGYNPEYEVIADNPWMYMSLDGYISLAVNICNSLTIIDESCADIYIDNLEKLKTRAEAVRTDVAGFNSTEAIAVLHPAFAYICRDINAAAVMADKSADIISELDRASARVVICDAGSYSEYGEALSAAEYTVVILDTGLAHGKADGDSENWFSIYRTNARKINSALSVMEHYGEG